MTELCRWPGMEPRAIFTRNIERAAEILRAGGVAKNNIAAVNTAQDLKDQLNAGRFVLVTDRRLIADLQGIEVVFDVSFSIFNHHLFQINILDV